MYAIFEDGGRQFQVEEGQELELDYREAPKGDQLRFDRVLAFRDDEGLRIGRPILESAAVTAEVLTACQGPKLVIQKFRRRKTYRRKTGHRQLYTRVRITKIEPGGPLAAPAPTPEGEGSGEAAGQAPMPLS
jgi:large subunit ribosomal protein L21